MSNRFKYMTDEDIIKSYQGAPSIHSKREHVQILADINNVSNRDIVVFLYEKGMLSKQEIGAYKRSGLLPSDAVSPRDKMIIETQAAAEKTEIIAEEPENAAESSVDVPEPEIKKAPIEEANPDIAPRLAAMELVLAWLEENATEYGYAKEFVTKYENLKRFTTEDC